MNRSMFRVALVVAVLVAAGGARMPAAQSGELQAMLGGIAERIQQYYDRFISIICTETVHQQELRFNLTESGRPRVTVYELSVSSAPRSKDESDFRVGRTLQTVNGRPARRNQEPGCTDPKTGTPEPLRFLLARNQGRFRFALADVVAGGPPGTRAIDFIETPPERVKITWNGNCFEAEGGGEKGRIWIDPITFDILQVEVHLAEPFLVPGPRGFLGPQPGIRVERSEVTMRFGRVSFAQPDETALLPESIDTLHVLRGVPSLRISQRLNNFRRFLSESSIRSTAY
jgi:hypothetical protein